MPGFGSERRHFLYGRRRPDALASRGGDKCSQRLRYVHDKLKDA
jgi:hypothetical protein